MVIELALALAIQHTNPGIHEPQAKQYAAWVMEEATTRHLDPWIFQALIQRETRWMSGLVRHESNGSCSVGLGQINGSCTESVVARMLDPHVNIQRMGSLLSLMRTMCHHDCQNLGWLRMYNPGSPAYLVAIRQAVKKYHAQASKPAVLRLPFGVHVSKLPRQSTGRSVDECRLETRRHHP